MKTLAKYHDCNHCVIDEKAFKVYLLGPGKLPAGLSRNGPLAGFFKEWATLSRTDKSLSSGYNVLQLIHFIRWITLSTDYQGLVFTEFVRRKW